jgi:hypothetical protein
MGEYEEFWNALILSGRSKALIRINIHPKFATKKWDELPRLARRLLGEMWENSQKEKVE